MYLNKVDKLKNAFKWRNDKTFESRNPLYTFLYPPKNDDTITLLSFNVY